MYLEAIGLERLEYLDKLSQFKDFYLAGGTALALQIGHRISKDFDLFIYGKELPENLLDKINEVFENKKIKILVNFPSQLSLKINSTNLTFLAYPFKPIFKFKVYKNLKLLSAKEITIDKAYVLGRRATFKDYVDLYFIVKFKIINLSNIIKFAKIKYKDLFNERLFLEELVYLKDVKNMKILFLKEKVNKQMIEKFFKEQFQKIKF